MSEDIRNHVTFATTLFNTTEVKDYFINPCCFGDDCAQWLINKLKAQSSVQVDEKPDQEDWGWYFFAKLGQQIFWVGVGLLEDEDRPHTWLVFVESQLSWMKRKIFGQSDQTELLAVCQALDQVLNSSPEISDIRWYTKGDWNKGEQEGGHSSPAEN